MRAVVAEIRETQKWFGAGPSGEGLYRVVVPAEGVAEDRSVPPTLAEVKQQLLAIARCLCGDPRLVLLDEPTEGIQPSIVDEIVETLQRLRAKSGLTMILVEQNLDFIAALSQRILIIQKGAITREVAPAELGDPGLVGEFVGIAT